MRDSARTRCGWRSSGARWRRGAERARGPRSTPPTRQTIPGSGPTTTSCGAPPTRASASCIDLGPDAPRWATADGAPLGAATGNREPDPREFARFAAAVGKRYSGDFEGLPKVEWFSIWNEPNHHFFLKPQRGGARDLPARWSPRRCRPCAMRRGADAKVLVGETAPIRQPGSVLGPRDFLRRWLCLDERLPAHAGRAGMPRLHAASTSTATRTTRTARPSKTPEARGHRQPAGDPPARALPRPRRARPGGCRADLPIYNTEFGLQSQPARSDGEAHARASRPRS